MKRCTFIYLLSLFLFLGLSGFGPVKHVSMARSNSTGASRFTLDQNYGKLPLAFEPNQGQTDPGVKYLARGAGYTLFIDPQETVLVLKRPGSRLKPVSGKRFQSGVDPNPTPDRTPPAVLRLKWEGAVENPAFESAEELPGVSNYFIGKDPNHWHTHIPQYSKVSIRGLYPGTDMIYYGIQGKLEYDLVVQPGGNPNDIHLRIEGSQGVGVSGQGDLELRTAQGQVVFRAPRLYQEIEGQRRPVEGRYRMEDGGRIGFEVKAYDHTKPLVLDPVLDYSTYLGGTGFDSGNAIAVDGSGNAYVTGQTESADFPTTTGAYQTTIGVATYGNAFVSKLNPQGSALVYSSYLGGDGTAWGTGIALDGSGNAYVTGNTYGDFPTTSGAYQTSMGAMFLSELDSSGSGLVYSTLLGGGAYESSRGVTVDGSGLVYVGGFTESKNFPTSTGAFQTSFNGGVEFGFVVKLRPEGNGASDLIYSTLLGGSEQQNNVFAITADGAGDAYVTGQTAATNFPTTAGAFQTALPGGLNAFVTEINPTGNGLVYSSYLGGNAGDWGFGISVDGSGNAWVVGQTYSTNFPTTSGAIQTSMSGGNDAFVAEMNPAGNALEYSTYYAPAGDFNNWCNAVALDAVGDAYVAGQSYTSSSGNWDGFLMEFTAGGSLAFSTDMGGGNWDECNGVALDGSGDVYVAGETEGAFPTTSGAYQTAYGGGPDDAFVVKFAVSNFYDPTLSPTVTPSFTPSLTPTATFTPTPSPTTTPTSTPTSTRTATATPTVTSTRTMTDTPTSTPTPGGSGGLQVIPTATVTGITIGSPYPNPCWGTHGQVTVPLQVPGGCQVECRLFTTAFRKIRDMAAPLPGGASNLVCELKDDGGRPVASGLYYLRIEVTGTVKASKTWKVLVLR